MPPLALKAAPAPLLTVKFPLTVSVPGGAVKTAVGLRRRDPTSLTSVNELSPGERLSILNVPFWVRVPLPDSAFFQVRSTFAKVGVGAQRQGAVAADRLVAVLLKVTRLNVLFPQASVNVVVPSNSTVPPLALKEEPAAMVKFSANEAVPAGAVRLAPELRLNAPFTSSGA